MSDPLPLTLRSSQSVSAFSNGTAFDNALRVAETLSKSMLVPPDYRGPAGIPNCMIALELSQRIGCSVLMVMQHMAVIHAKPAWSSSFLIAAIEASGMFTPLRYEETDLGEITIGKVNYRNLSCVAYATEKATGQLLKSIPITVEMSVKEGWWTRSGSKWPNMTLQMLRYRAAAFFNRTFCPGLTMGLHTREEMEDVATIDVTPAPTVKVSETIAIPARAPDPVPEPAAAQPELIQTELTPHQRALKSAMDERGLTPLEVSQAYNELSETEKNRASVADFTAAEIGKIMPKLQVIQTMIETFRASQNP